MVWFGLVLLLQQEQTIQKISINKIKEYINRILLHLAHEPECFLLIGGHKSHKKKDLEAFLLFPFII